MEKVFCVAEAERGRWWKMRKRGGKTMAHYFIPNDVENI